VQGDVRDEQVNKEAVELAIKKWGRLDAVILNAGVVEFARVANVVSKSLDSPEPAIVFVLGAGRTR